MKRFKSLFLAFILVLALCVGLVACGESESKTKKYNLTFEMNGHGSQIAQQVLKENEVTVQPTNPTESGWEFKGWYTDNNFSQLYTFGSTLSSDTTVYAKWEQEVTKYAVTFVTGVSDCVINAQDVVEGGKVTLPSASDMVSKGKKFEGWYLDAGHALPFDENIIVTQGFSIYAKWSTYYKVTFDRNGRGSTNRTPQPQEYFVEGSKAEKPEDMSANSYKFIGWSLDKSGLDNLYDFDTELVDSITLFAQWVRLYTVSFDLNNDDALQPNPDKVTVEEGKCISAPNDPHVIGYKFDGWYTKAEGGEKIDFNVFAITSTTTVYAHWTKIQVGTLDVDTPDVDYNKEAPYGERPDLEGFIIDGKMGEAEKWGEQNWYSTATVDAPTVSYALTSQFSDKGLYLFFTVKDNGGLYHAGNNLIYRNSHLEFAVTDGNTQTYHSRLVKTFTVDTYSLFPSYNRAKIAVYIAEGEVNTSSSDNKSATMHVEAFITWKDLGIDVKPDTVKIETVYKYKRLSSDVIKYTLATPFTNESSFEEMKEYIEYDGNGYIKKDAINAIVGDSPYGTSKTADWDINNESAENDAYVLSNGSKLQAIFFKEKVETNYFEVNVSLDATSAENGKAGIMVYANNLNYASLVFAINGETYDKAQSKFILAKPQMRITDNNGKEQVINLPEIDVSSIGKIDVKVIFHNGYFYCIVNGRFIYCRYIDTLNTRLVPALTAEYCEGIKFRNYTLSTYTQDESNIQIGKYAYLIECAKLNSLTVEFNSVGVSVDNGSDKSIVMTLTNNQLALTQKQKEEIRANGMSAVSSINMKQIKKLMFTVNGVEHDITPALIDAQTGAKFGSFVYNYQFDGNGILSNESEDVNIEDIAVVLGKVIDKSTGKTVTASALVETSNPRLGRYETKIQNGDMVVFVPKGYEYKITISQTTYRNVIVEGIADFEDRKDVGNLELIYNILGGVATNANGSFSIGSGAKGWDMSNESNNEIILTTDFDPPTVYFTGKTVHEYQYAKVTVSNITDVNDYAVYEPDPAIGFQFYTEEKRAFIGLRTTGLRYRSDCSVWAPVQISGYGKNTVNHIDPTGSHKDTLEIIRINRNLYSYINGFYMGHIVLDKEFEGECAIGVQATIAYYGKIRYSDYEIKVGEDALAIAKERVGLSVSYDDSMFEYNEEYEADYSKPFIKVEGIMENANLALAGSTFTLSLTEYAIDGAGYSVNVGSYGSVILTEQNPVAKFTLPTTAVGELEFSCLILNLCVVTGKIEGEGAVGPFDGIIIAQDGSIIKFTTGEDGSFTVGVPASMKFSVQTDVDGYVSPVLSSQTEASGEKNIGIVTLYRSILGGKVKGTQYESSLDGIELGYDEDSATVIDGLYADVNVTSGDHYVAINDKTYDDFDLTYSIMRTKYQDRQNETDPGIGVKLRTAMGSESLLFFRDGVRIVTLEGWSKRIEQFKLMPFNIASAYDEVANFRIIRKGSLCIMYYKSATDSEWTEVFSFESNMFGPAGLLFHSTNGTNNHYYIWNVKVDKITSSYVPDDIISALSLTNLSGEEKGTASISGASVIDGKTEYVYGDLVKIKLNPTQGNVVAYVKINGQFIAVSNNEVTYKITQKSTDIEVAFEKEYASVNALLKVESKYSLDNVNIVAKLSDGRIYEYKNLTFDENGNTQIPIREGEFEIWADSENVTSKSIKANVTPQTTSLGTVNLDVLKPGKITVNGVDLSFTTPMGEEGLRKDGAYTAPSRVQQHAWIPASKTSGDFVFSTAIVMSGNPESIYYAKDNCSGVTFSDGTNRFAIQMWCNGFRVYSGSYDQNKMIEPRFSGAYFYSTTSSEDIEHTLTVARKGTTLKVYVDGTYYMTLDKSGYSIINESGSLFVSDAQESAVATLLTNTFGSNANKEIVVGYSTCINTANAGHLNSAGFKNTSIITNPDIVNEYFN
ncbi:MAG: hypothetical protein E7353_03810 [Clostridiales bacterium]|nr:hypothetical protein [Clostridiales bacterium]